MKCAVLVLILVAVGCKSDKAGLEKLAASANPVIQKLQPNVAVVLKPGADPKTVRTACLQAVADAGPLESLKFDDRRGDEDTIGINDVLVSFSMGEAANHCQEDNGDGTRDARCVRYCTEMFHALSEALDRFHKKHAEFETFTK